MKIIRCTEPGFRKKIEALNRRAMPDPAVAGTVTEIIDEVRRGGDAAVIRLGKKFGGAPLRSSKLLASDTEVRAAVAALPANARRAINASRRNVATFAKHGLRESWFMKNAQGAIVGERFDPFDRVGIYVPGGTAPLVSTAVMTCSLAATAGVSEVVACTPPGPEGRVNPILLAALSLCGATEIYRAGGAQAVAAMALGTKQLRPVRKIFGPGNAYVVEAKRQFFGVTAIDLLPGPSEILIIADAEANAAWIAADLLAQSEHGHGSQSVLLTDSSKLLAAVRDELDRQTELSKRSELLADALADCTLVRVRNLNQAVELANAFAAEHVAIATADPGTIAGRLTSAGAVFLGGWSPVAAGDFLAGPSHELPTGGAGKSFAGLTADQFQRRTSFVRYDRAALEKSRRHLATFAEIEGLDAHGRSVAVRLEE